MGEAAWIGILSSALGTALGAGIGGFIAVRVARVQARLTAELARESREEDHSRTLWERSRTAATDLLGQFNGLVRLTRPLYRRYREPGPGFDDLFDDYWEDDDPTYRALIALLPSQQHRAALEIVCDGIDWNYAVAKHTAYQTSAEQVVLRAAQLGAEITSSWLRGERSFPASVREQVVELDQIIQATKSAVAEGLPDADIGPP